MSAWGLNHDANNKYLRILQNGENSMIHPPKDVNKALIAGYGVAGQSLAKNLMDAGIRVAGYLDDVKFNHEVIGKLDDANRLIKELGISKVFFAIPSASSEVLLRFIQNLDDEGVELAVVPRTYNIIAKDSVDITDLSDVDVLDLVGRAPVKHDMLIAKQHVEGKKILVTGAAGSIGSRLVEQLLSLSPQSVTCIDRNENGIFRLWQKHSQNSLFDFYVADVQEEARMNHIFEAAEPEIVYHAAAFKHVPLMETNPIEAMNNNVWGTLNVMNLSGFYGAESFVYVSTDKAVNPANVMGATKRIGELLISELGSQFPKTKYSGVRFGNVLQSDGSVMQIFREQIANKKPLTITHPEITRYFMTIDEASQLIIQAGALANQSDLFVLDMGEPIKVIDLAKGLIRAVNPNLEIKIIGLRPGEKMFEELSYATSKKASTSHPKIFVLTEETGKGAGNHLEWVKNLITLTKNNQIHESDVVQSLKSHGILKPRE